MADQFVSVPNSGSAKVDTSELTVNSQTVERQRINIADPTGAAALAAVENAAPGISDYGLITRPVGSGQSVYHAVSAASNNAVNIKGSAGLVYGWQIFNNAGYVVYVKLYNKATTPAPASDTPVLTIGVQAGTSIQLVNSTGIAFATGIGIAIVKGISDSDNTSVAASDCVVNVEYK